MPPVNPASAANATPPVVTAGPPALTRIGVNAPGGGVGMVTVPVWVNADRLPVASTETIR